MSSANKDIPSDPVGRTEVIRYKAKDGREIEALLTYPVGYERGKRYPLLLNIHGGPAGVFTRSFIAAAALYAPPEGTRPARILWRPSPPAATRSCAAMSAAAVATARNSASRTSRTGAAAITRTRWPASITWSPGIAIDAGRWA